MMKSNAKATYEFQRWNRTVGKQLKVLLQSLPVWSSLDQYADEQGLTEALAPYARLEGDLEQTLQRLQSWVLTAQQYCKQLLRDPGLYFSKYVFGVHCAPNRLELELVLEYYPPEMITAVEEGEVDWEDFGPLPRYAPFGCVIAKVGIDQFCIYVTTDKGFEVEIDHHNGRLPYECYEFSAWNNEVESQLQTLLQHLKVMRSIDYYVEWGGFGGNLTYSAIEGNLKIVLEAIQTWVLSTTRYTQEAIADPRLTYFRYVYSVHMNIASLSLDIFMEQYMGNQLNRNWFAGCNVFRIGKHRFQIVAHTESVCQQWLEKMRWVRSASHEELLAAGWIPLDSSVGSYETPGHAGRTYYTSEEEPSPKPAKGDLKPQSPRRSE